MRFFLYTPKFLNRIGYAGMALFPFILYENPELKENKTFINHETIHLKQQAEMLVLPFYVVYLSNYAFNYLKYKDHDTAYRNICFEREAYTNEQNLDYLKKRSFWAWLNYL